jgi:hypothetical protein
MKSPITMASVFGIAKQCGWIQPEVNRPGGAVETNKLPQTKKTTNNKNQKPITSNTRVYELIVKRYVFLKNHNRIFDTVTRNELTREGFDGAYMHQIQDVKPSIYLLKNPVTIKVDGLIYLPGETRNPIQRNGATLWNIWLDPNVVLPDTQSLNRKPTLCPPQGLFLRVIF